MRTRGPLPVLAVDVLCGAVLATCVTGLLWMTVVRRDDSRAALRAIGAANADAQRDLAALRALRDEQRALLVERRRQLAERGTLPDQPPLVDYFQTVATLAGAHGLQVVRQKPGPALHYPGLQEHRVEYELTGAFTDLVAFLRAVEEVDFWGDVGYLKVQCDPAARDSDSPSRLAQLTFSLFSTPPPEPAPEAVGAS